LITAVTLGELSFGPHATDDPLKRPDGWPGGSRANGASDLMIAATAASNQLPLYTANPDDFKGLEGLVEVIGVKGPPNNL
jgi:hypothetical protein